MQLRHILVATDDSEAGRQAVRTGLDLSARASARLTVLRVVTVKAVPLSGAVGICADAAVQVSEHAHSLPRGSGSSTPGRRLCRRLQRGASGVFRDPLRGLSADLVHERELQTGDLDRIPALERGPGDHRARDAHPAEPGQVPDLEPLATPHHQHVLARSGRHPEVTERGAAHQGARALEVVRAFLAAPLPLKLGVPALSR